MNLIKKQPSFFLIFGILLLAYLIRIYKPEVFISDVDYPGHIVASMRLFSTSLFEIYKPTANLIVQLFSFSHGFSTIGIPALLYGLFFKLGKLSVTESNLVYINSLLGISSIYSFYLFVKQLYDEKRALWSALIYSLLPIHISLSRLHVGSQILQSFFFYLSFYFLLRFIKKNNLNNKLFYFISLFFLIGSDNAFPIALLMQFAYYMFFRKDKKESFLKKIKSIIMPLYISLPLVLGPLLAYIAIDLLRIIKYGSSAPGGFILRTLTKTGRLVFLPDRPFLWSLELIGPVSVFFILILFSRNIFKNPINRFFVLTVFIYGLFLSLGTNIERNYIFYTAGIIVLVTVDFFEKQKYLLFLITLLTVIYSASVMYGAPFGSLTTKTYGSTQWNAKNNDLGVKTLGYLIRKGILKTERTINDKVTKLNIGFDFLGGWYYLGNYYYDLPKKDISELRNMKNALYVIQPTSQTDGTTLLRTIIENKKLYKIALIKNENIVLLEVYGNTSSAVVEFDVNSYNERFDREFGNIDSLGKLYLGIY